MTDAVDRMTAVRTATPQDLEAILDLQDAQRSAYAEYQPVFWNPAPDARDRQRPYLGGQLTDPDVIVLVSTTGIDTVVGFAIGVITAAPPVYAPGGLTCLVDDFTLGPAADWATDGVDLLIAVRLKAAGRGAVQVVVVTAALHAEESRALRRRTGQRLRMVGRPDPAVNLPRTTRRGPTCSAVVRYRRWRRGRSWRAWRDRRRTRPGHARGTATS